MGKVMTVLLISILAITVFSIFIQINHMSYYDTTKKLRAEIRDLDRNIDYLQDITDPRLFLSFEAQPLEINLNPNEEQRQICKEFLLDYYFLNERNRPSIFHLFEFMDEYDDVVLDDCQPYFDRQMVVELRHQDIRIDMQRCDHGREGNRCLPWP